METIGSSLAKQYDRAWEMMRATIGRFSAEEWRAGERPNLVPARWAYHAIEAADFYARPSPEGFRFGGQFGVDWEAPAPEQPGQKQMLEYLAEVQSRLGGWLRGAPDDELLAGQPFHWTGQSVLERMEYTLRHTMYHLGELSMLLRLSGADETEWR